MKSWVVPEILNLIEKKSRKRYILLIHSGWPKGIKDTLNGIKNIISIKSWNSSTSSFITDNKINFLNLNDIASVFNNYFTKVSADKQPSIKYVQYSFLNIYPNWIQMSSSFFASPTLSIEILKISSFNFERRIKPKSILTKALKLLIKDIVQ